MSRKRSYTVRGCTHVRVKHLHGTVAGYKQDGCRCRPCTDAAVASDAARLKLIAYGRWDCWVDSIGTVRRLQALTAAGWSSAELGRQAGMTRCALNRLRAYVDGTGRVRRVTHDRVAYMYDRLWHVTPTGRYQARSERHAARAGWAAPWQWDGLNMDDPNTAPHPPVPADGIDEIAVERYMAGTLRQRPNINATPERVEAVRRLAAYGYSDREIGQRVGMTATNVGQFRLRHDIPAGVASSRPNGPVAA